MEIQLEGKSFDTYSNWMKSVKCINEEITLTLDENSVQVIGMDPSHVAMIDARIAGNVFKSYNVKPIEGDKEVYSLNVGEYLKFLDRLDSKQKVTLASDVERAKLTLKGDLKGRTRRFDLPLLEPLDEEVPSPKIKFHGTVKMPLSALYEATKDASLVSEHVVFKATEDSLTVTGSGDNGDAFSEWSKDSEEILSYKVDEDTLGTYTLSYIMDILNAMKSLADVATISTSTDMPIKIEAHGPKVENEDPLVVKDPQNLWDLVYYLAPCIGV